MLVSHENKYIFIHIPKTGGTALSESLIPFMQPSDICVPGDGERIHEYLHYHTPARYAIRAFAELGWNWNEYTSVVIIRNPFEILHSDYWFHRYIGETKWKNPPPEDLEDYEWQKKCYESQYQTFTDYCTRVYGHWDRGFYHHYCCDDARENQIVSRVFLYDNTLHDIWWHAKAKFGLPIELEIEKINATNQVCGKERPKIQDDYTPKLIELVNDVFRYDLARFGFTLENAQ